MKCTGCGHVTTSRTARFCPSCGAELPTRVIDLTEATVPAARVPAEARSTVPAGPAWAPPSESVMPPRPAAPPPVDEVPAVEPYVPPPVAAPAAARRRSAFARHARLIVAAAAAVTVVALVFFGAQVLRKSCGERLGPRADLASCGFARADLSGRDLSGANLSGADLTGANLRSAVLAGANLRDAKLSGADATSARFTDADLTGAVLDDTTLTSALLGGATVREVSLRRATLDPASELSGLDFTGATFDGVDLTGARLGNATLDGASLRDVTLNQASLDGASLRGATIEGSRLVGAFLGGADLTNATVADSDLGAADLRGVTFTGATLSGLRLHGAVLFQTKGLDDATLAKAVGAGATALGAFLSANRIRLEERDAILASLGRACRGTPVPAASPRQGSFHPLVIRDAAGNVSSWSDSAASAGWEPMAARFGQQVACVQEAETSVQRCRYTEIGGLGRSGSITRYRHTVRLRVFDAKTGSLRLDRTFQGSQPDACPAVTSFQANGRMDGTTPDFATARPVLAGVVGQG